MSGMDTSKHLERVAAGLKATVHNPNVSGEAKHRALHRLEEMGVDVDKPASSKNAHEADDTGQAEMRQAEKKKGHPADFPASEEHRGQAHAMSSEAEAQEHHMLGGYKATLKNANASEKAKKHAEQILKEHGALPND
ncbi:hypothetical protein BDZ97DRAFT_1918695 [Flammula alnicola]|nr:hypothetical protein BDZ97DRAFT_1918695 [Flammula alnicola]